MHLTWPARRESSENTPYILSFNYSSATRADFSVDRFDPSFPWLFATIAVLFLFDRIRVTDAGAQRALEWTGRRSYSIYLLQYTAIAIVAPFVYDALLAGGIGGFVAPHPAASVGRCCCGIVCAVARRGVLG